MGGYGKIAGGRRKRRQAFTVRRDLTAFSGVVRLLCAALALCAVVLAPMGVNLLHSPAGIAVAADLHAPGKGHVHAETRVAGHDASDHDQPVRLQPARATDDAVPGHDSVAPTGRIAAPGTIREGPRRPPRLA
jgi:hypothetical protein